MTQRTYRVSSSLLLEYARSTGESVRLYLEHGAVVVEIDGVLSSRHARREFRDQSRALAFALRWMEDDRLHEGAAT